MRQKAAVAVSVFQELGQVLSVEGGVCLVSTPSGRFEAKRAASCLLAPAPGDRVLVAVPPEGSLFVLAILERDETAVAELELGAEARLRAGKRLMVSAGEELDLAGETVRVGSEELVVTAKEGTFAVKKASLFHGALSLYADVVTALVTRVESHLDTLSVHSKNTQRFTEQLELVRAGTYDVQAEQTLKLRGEHTFLAGDGLCKLDGEQIHLG